MRMSERDARGPEDDDKPGSSSAGRRLRRWKTGVARSNERPTGADVVWLAMLITPCETARFADGARGGTPMAARSRTAFTSVEWRIRL